MLRRVAPAFFLVAALVAGCTSTPATPPNEPGTVVRSFAPEFQGAPDLPPPDMTDDGPGSLVSVQPLTINVDLAEIDATVFRVIYRSTSGIDGSATEVSGLVVMPPGVPPQGGWPLISFGHGTTGVLEKCAPSLYDNFLGNGKIIAALVLGGFAVTMSDYQGLGVPGFYHPLLDSETAGNNMIDAVRAARKVIPGLSKRWSSFGISLGGMAAWAAADRSGTYGKDLDLVSTVSLVPVADMSGLADAAQNGTLTKDQLPLMVYLLQSLSWTTPDFDLDNYRSGYAKAHWDEVLDCIPPDFVKYDEVVGGMSAADFKPRTQADTDRLREIMQAKALPKNKVNGPMLIQYGTEDQLVAQNWTEKALAAACAQGDYIDIEKRIGEGHNDLDSSRAFPWLKDRLTGQPSINSCPGGT